MEGRPADGGSDAGATDAGRDGGQIGAGGSADGLGTGGGGGGGGRIEGAGPTGGGGGGESRMTGSGDMDGQAGGGVAAPPGTAGSLGTTGGGDGQGGGDGAPPPDPAALPPVVGDLTITELLINPLGTDTGREWIEIVNRAAHAVALAKVHVADAANDAPLDFAVLAGAPPILIAGARAVLIQSADATKNGGVTVGRGGVAPVVGAFGTHVSLNNDGDTISLCAGACADGVVLDRVAWDASLGAAYDGHALSIDDGGHRCPAAAAFGDAGSFGTPGGPNPPCP
jgi:hypothetical protein